MKKIKLFCSVAILTLALTACGGNSDPGGDPGKQCQHVSGEWVDGSDTQYHDYEHHYKFCIKCGEMLEKEDHHYVTHGGDLPSVEITDAYGGLDVDFNPKLLQCDICAHHKCNSQGEEVSEIVFEEEVIDKAAFIADAKEAIRELNHLIWNPNAESEFDVYHYYYVDNEWYDSYNGHKVNIFNYNNRDFMYKPFEEMEICEDTKIFKVQSGQYYLAINDFSTYDFVDRDDVDKLHTSGSYFIFDSDKRLISVKPSYFSSSVEVKFERDYGEDYQEVVNKIYSLKPAVNDDEIIEDVLDNYVDVYCRAYGNGYHVRSFTKDVKFFEFDSSDGSVERCYYFKDYDGYHFVDKDEEVALCDEGYIYDLVPDFDDNRTLMQNVLNNMSFCYSYHASYNENLYELYYESIYDGNAYWVTIEIDLSSDHYDIAISDHNIRDYETFRFVLNNYCTYEHEASSRVPEIYNEYHVHGFETDWSYDDDYHWHATLCGHDEVVEKIDHEWSEWTIDTPATCKAPGKEVRECSCGAVQEREIEQLEHEWGDWTFYSKATPEEKGKERRYCANCDEFEERDVDYVFDPDDWTFYSSFYAIPESEHLQTSAFYNDDPTIVKNDIDIKAVEITKETYLAAMSTGTKTPLAILDTHIVFFEPTIPTTTVNLYVDGVTSSSQFNSILSNCIVNETTIDNMVAAGYTVEFHKYVLKADTSVIVGYGIKLTQGDSLYITVDCNLYKGCVSVLTDYKHVSTDTYAYAFDAETAAALQEEYKDHIVP